MGVKLYIGNLPFGTTDQELQDGTVENFTPMANTCPRGDSQHQLEGMFKKVRPVLNHAEGKAANCLLGPAGPPRCFTREAYMEYVSTAKWRERRLARPILKGGPFVFNIPKTISLHMVQGLQPRSWQVDLQDGHEDLGLWKCPLNKKLSR